MDKYESKVYNSTNFCRIKYKHNEMHSLKRTLTFSIAASVLNSSAMISLSFAEDWTWTVQLSLKIRILVNNSGLAFLITMI